jgi:hypothetical protein
VKFNLNHNQNFHVFKKKEWILWLLHTKYLSVPVLVPMWNIVSGTELSNQAQSRRANEQDKHNWLPVIRHSFTHIEEQ